MDQNCHVELVEKPVSAEDLTDARIVRLAVSGMGCVNCGARVRNGLLALDGVVSADVDWEQGLALVDYVPVKTNVDAMVHAVTASGNDGRHNYRAKVIS
ncbi:MAG: cation transporter [Chloroflexi bacterium]|nr:cation transporter [Chloroflexota bacterium]